MKAMVSNYLEKTRGRLTSTFWPRKMVGHFSTHFLSKSCFPRNRQKSDLGAQKNRFFSKVKQFQRNPQNSFESAWKARFEDIWVGGLVSSCFEATGDFLKWGISKNVDFPESHLRFPRELGRCDRYSCPSLNPVTQVLVFWFPIIKSEPS